jgi:hypothetical protein
MFLKKCVYICIHVKNIDIRIDKKKYDKLIHSFQLINSFKNKITKYCFDICIQVYLKTIVQVMNKVHQLYIKYLWEFFCLSWQIIVVTWWYNQYLLFTLTLPSSLHCCLLILKRRFWTKEICCFETFFFLLKVKT